MRFLADENFNRVIVTGLKRAVQNVNIALVQEVDLRNADDPTILEWAAREGRAVLTHDVATMPDFAFERVAAGKRMPGREITTRYPCKSVNTSNDEALWI